MTTQALKTIRDYIRWAWSQFQEADLFFGHGSDNAWDEAVHLVLTALYLEPDVPLEIILEARLTDSERKKIESFIQERVQTRRPLAYLMQKAWFAGLSFYVDERVLIPRSPIAELVEVSFEPWLDPEKVEGALDLCTGSGSLAIIMALALPQAQIDAVDISEDALAVAQKNVLDYGLENQITLIQSDLFEGLAHKQYELIVSNPPYVSQEEYEGLPSEYHHEPKIALQSGIDGLEAVGGILKRAAHYLKPEGVLIVEVGSLQAAVEAAFPEYPFTWIQFSQGGEGVFLLTAQDLLSCL